MIITISEAVIRMVKIALQIKATLECVDRIYANHPDMQWFLRLKCDSCGEETDKWHDLIESQKVAQKHNRSESHLIIKCKLCSRENSLDIVEGSNGNYRTDDSGKFKTIVMFDCRGVQPIEFCPRGGWLVESEENGRKFDNVDLTEREWVEYDDKNNTSVGIYDFESQFIKVK